MGPRPLDDQGWRRTNGSTYPRFLVIAVAASTVFGPGWGAGEMGGFGLT